MSEMASQMGANGQEGALKFKRFGYMMDSMTDEELDNPKVNFTRERTERIARGSGRHLREVEELLTQYRQFAKVFGKVGKMSKKSKMRDDQLNMGAVQSMQQHLDPRMLSQLGGAQNLNKLMQDMAKHMGPGGGFPGLDGM